MHISFSCDLYVTIMAHFDAFGREHPLHQLPSPFRWRGRPMTTIAYHGPEHIAPEWWLENPNWRSGVRNYWQVTCAEGDQLWLFLPMARLYRAVGFAMAALPDAHTYAFSLPKYSL